MKQKTKNKCQRTRRFFLANLIERFITDSDWMHNHIANCPRCQARLIGIGRIEMGLAILKSQPHKLDLLMRANSRAIGTLKHSLRGARRAEKLRHIKPEPSIFQRIGNVAGAVGNVAACITIVLLMKIGVFSTMDKFDKQGNEMLKEYYASRVGDDITDDIFTG